MGKSPSSYRWLILWRQAKIFSALGKKLTFFPSAFPNPKQSVYLCSHKFNSVQLLSRVRLFATPGITARQASLSITNSRSSLTVASIESVMPSNHLVLCRSLPLLPSILPSISFFSNEMAVHSRWPKYFSFSFSLSPSNEYSGLISFRINWFDHLAVQGLSRVFSNTTVQKHKFFSTQPSLWSNSYTHT